MLAIYLAIILIVYTITFNTDYNHEDFAIAIPFFIGLAVLLIVMSLVSGG